MSVNRLWIGVAVAIGFAVACSNSAPHESQPVVELSDEIVAAVGTQTIGRQAVLGVMREQKLGAKAAAEALVADLLFATEFESRAPDTARYLRSVAAARAMTEQLLDEARQMGPATDQEVQTLSEQRWWQFERPVSSRTTHAVVLVKKGQDPKPAEQYARELHEKLSGISDPKAFKAAAEALRRKGFELKVEDLDPVTEDGRVINLLSPPPPGMPPQRFAKEYAEAAASIPKVGQISPVVHSAFGYHIILLTERVPGHRVPMEERRKMMLPEIVQIRARKLEAKLLESAAQEYPVEVERNAVAATEVVGVR